MHLDGRSCYAELEAADEKNGEGSSVPVRDDLAADLRHWLAERLAELQAEARATGRPVPLRLPPDLPLFAVPDKLSKILNRDLKAAGIPKRDDRGRVLDVHALRTTFGTLLSKGGVSPRTAQAAMRHSKLELTMSVYTDPKLLDVRGALGVLPTLPLDGPGAGTQAGVLTGTDPGAVAPAVAPATVPLGHSPSIAVHNRAGVGISGKGGHVVGSATAVNGSGPLSSADNGPSRVGATGLEPVTPSVSSWCSSQLS